MKYELKHGNKVTLWWFTEPTGWVFTVDLGDTVSSSIYSLKRVERGKECEDKLTQGHEASDPSSPLAGVVLSALLLQSEEDFPSLVAALVSKVSGDPLLNHHC